MTIKMPNTVTIDDSDEDSDHDEGKNSEVKTKRRGRPMFVELEHLETVEEVSWVEKARWIKLEEDVEEGSKRWTPPFVPSLSYEAMSDLKYCLDQGAALLHVQYTHIKDIATAIVDALLSLSLLSTEDAELLFSALLSRHLHQHQTVKKSYTLKKNTTKVSVQVDSAEGNCNVQRLEDSEPALSEDVIRGKSDLERRILPNSEVCTILTAYLPYLSGPCAVFIRLANCSELGELSEIHLPVRFIVFIAGPADVQVDYYESGRCMGVLMSDSVFKDLVYMAEVKEDILSGIDQFLQDCLVLPPGVWDRKLLQQSVRKLESQAKARTLQRRETVYLATDVEHAMPLNDTEDPLARTGKFCGGLIQDIKRKAMFYKSDFTQGFSLRCLVSILFIYFAALAPAVTFGALLSEHTNGLLGVSEMVLATGLAGVLFGMFAGQPLIILGATGPLLVMEESMYDLAKSLNVEFLPWRAWIGLWVFVICFFIVAFDLSFLVRYFTRFTEEIFAFLVSAIFIYEAIGYGVHMYMLYPFAEENAILPNNTSALNATSLSNNSEVYHPNKGLLSVILMLLTFFFSYIFRKFRHSQYFPLMLRRLLSDFGILIAVILVVGIDILLKDKITDKLKIPDGFTTTSSDRQWLVKMTGEKEDLSLGMIFLAFLPALLVSFIVFMETELTGLIMDKKENKLVKGCGYHLDLLVVGGMVCVCAFLGLPFMCASPVHSVSHLNSLSILCSSHAPGMQQQVVGVHEQRVSNIIMHVLVGVSVLLAPMLRLIPISVLFGVFLYLGIISVTHLQLFKRMQMLFIPPKHHPDNSYVRRVATRRINLFTVIQSICLGVLVFIKTSIIAPAFPLFVLCLIPLRSLLGKIFTEEELESLDNEAEDGDDLDEYESVHVPI